MSTDAPPDLTALRSTFSGELIEPDHHDFDVARHIWNGAIDKRPRLVARCQTVDDVGATIGFARRAGLELSVRGGGHSLPGFSSSDGGVVLDLSPMHVVEVDPEAGTARVAGGATWAQYDAATDAHGLGSTGGLISTTGVAGLTLGGGMGWLTRKHGLACDELLSVEVVTADGAVLRASAEENGELFWALRGGGGNFGVVTSFEFRVQPVGTVLGGLVLFPSERAGEIARFYRDFIADLPDELTTLLVATTAPPLPFVPEDLQFKPAIAIAACYSGDLEEGERVIKPLGELGAPVEVLAPMPYPALQSMQDESAPAGLHCYFKSGYLSELGDGAVNVVDEQLAARAHPLSQIHLHHMGGAFARVGEDDTAFSGRDALITYNIVGICETSEQFEATRSWVRETADRLGKYKMERAYVNFMGDADGGAEAAYGASKYARLRAVKRRYDPENLFRLNQNVEP
jgi:FAD/FMN-containing dehydrogenase